MKRPLLALSALSLSALVSAQDLSKPISYTTPALSLRRICADLSNNTGARLRVSDELANEPMILRLVDVPAREAMDRIASATSAEWRDLGNGEWLLARPAPLVAQLRRQSLARRTREIEKGLSEVEKTYAQPWTAESMRQVAVEYATAVKLQGQTGRSPTTSFELMKRLPDPRALIRALRVIGPEQLAQVEAGQRVVFSDRPTKMQVGVSGFGGIAQKLKQERDAFAAELAKQLPDDKETVRITSSNPHRALEEVPAKLVVIVTREPLGDTLRTSFLAYDGNGLSTAYSWLPVMPRQNAFENALKKLAEPSDPEEAALELDEPSQALLDAYKNIYRNGGDPPPPGRELIEALKRADSYDPLRLLVSPSLLALAERKQKNMVVYPDDSFLMLAGIAASFKDPRPSALLTALRALVAAEEEEDERWITWKPVDPLETAQIRTNRETLAKFYKEVDSQGYVSLDTAAQFALAEQEYAEPPLARTIHMLLGRFYSPYYQRDRNALRLFGTLTSEQREALEKGESVPALAPRQRERLAALAFADGHGLAVRSDVSSPEDAFDWARSEGEREPTEFMPDGLPDGLTLKGGLTEDDALFVRLKTSAGGEFTQEMDFDHLAYTIARSESPVPNEGDPLEVVWVSKGKSRTLSFDIRLTSRHSKRVELKEMTMVGEERWSLDQLPTEMRKQLDEALKYRRQERTPASKPEVKP